MDWTPQQKEAIELRDKNILVAAAAGSGKTAVLVERIKRLVIEERCPVDRMLVVTFTNAAAAEMKEKIYKAINKAYSGNHEMSFLREQLNLLQSANISTFHSFALEVIKRYFYVINVEPNFKICDQPQQMILRGQAMDSLLEELFEESSPEFLQFLRKYSGDRNEDRFREMVEKTFDTIISLPEPFQWLHEKVETLNTKVHPIGENPAIQALKPITEEKLNSFEKWLNMNLKNAGENGLEGAETLALQDIETLKNMKDMVLQGDLGQAKEALSGFRLGNIRKNYFYLGETSEDLEKSEMLKSSAEINRNNVKDGVKKLLRNFFMTSEEELSEEIGATYEDGKFLERAVGAFAKLYSQKKKEKNVVDFSDIEHFAYEILKDEEAAGFYREKFLHIFIDEYQDSNVIQEALIDRIRRPANLFMVGDVKQSIYKFRLAEPEIFQRRYRDYGSGQLTDSCKIDLNKNFRSKKPIIDFVNETFDYIMDGYDEDAALHLGDSYGDRSYHEPVLYLTSVPWSDTGGDEELDDELKNIIKAEKEALAAAKIIKDSVGKPFFDSKAGEERSLELRDIVILMRGIKSYGDIFYNVLTENSIAAYVDDNDGYFDTLEINLFLSLLMILDNRNQDIPLMTVMRSEILGFTIEEMVKIRTEQKDGPYYRCFRRYGQEGSNQVLRAKCLDAAAKMDKWQEMTAFMPIDKLVWELLLDTGLYMAMGAIPGGGQRQANLRALTDKAMEYRKNQGGNLYGFIGYAEAVKERKVAMGQVKLVGENDQLVKIMTIHKSKGLEFPMVLVAGFCRNLNYTTMGKSVVIHKDLGLGFPIVDYKNHWYKTTAIQNIIKEKFHQEEVEEEKRILYVAMTRAKDRLVLLGIDKDVNKALEKAASEPSRDSSYFAMTSNRICTRLDRGRIIGDEQLTALIKGRQKKNTASLKLFNENLSTGDEALSKEIERRMTFSYEGSELAVKSKYSVSELNMGSKDRPPIENLTEPACFKMRETFSSVQKGTIYHCVIEHMDMGEARSGGVSYIESLIKLLVDKMYMTEEEAAVIEIESILTLINSDIGRRMAESKAVYRERPFNLIEKVEGQEVIVQGIIDCFFEEADGLVLVDYKTNYVRPGRDIEAEKQRIAQGYVTQMDIYRKALETVTGRNVKESYLYLFGCGELVKMY